MQAESRERISLDIFTVIIEILSFGSQLNCPEERRCLQNLSLTCRRLRPLCQQALFHRVSIFYAGEDHGANRMLSFLDLADSSPVPLASYIKDFSYVIGKDLPTTTLTSCFLSKLKNVRKLGLSGHIRKISYPYEWTIVQTTNWLSLEEPLADAFVELVQVPYLESLSLMGFNHFPTRLLSSLKDSTSLTDLSFDCLQIDEEGLESDILGRDKNAPCPHILRYLNLGRFCHSVSSFLHRKTTGQNPVFDFTQLQRFTVRWDQQGDVDDTKLLMRSARRLETLECELTSTENLSFRSLAEIILSGPCSTLCSLKAIVHHAFDVDPFRGLVLELEKLSENLDSLETISIELRDYDNLPDEMLETQLRFLDSLFPAAFPSLQKLSIFGVVEVDRHLALQGVPQIEDDYEYFNNQVSEMVQKNCPNILQRDIVLVFEMFPRWC